MLKLAGESDVGLEKIETIEYEPGLQDTGDLESGTNTITATAEASGTGNADYNASLTLAKPDDARLVVKCIAARLAVTIDSMTAGHLYCRVYVDSQDTNHRLFDEDWASAGAKLDAADTRSGVLSTIFDALSDGASHAFYFFFWVDTGNAVLSLVQLWEGVGSNYTGMRRILDLIHTGLLSIFLYGKTQGSGTRGFSASNDTGAYYFYQASAAELYPNEFTFLVTPEIRFSMKGTVATDLNYLFNFAAIIRSEQ